MSSRVLCACVSVLAFGGLAFADDLPTPSPFGGASTLAGNTSSLAGSLIFEHGTETGSRYNPQSSPALPGGYTAANTIAFTNCVFDGGNTSAILDTLRFGIRQGGGSPDVDLRIFVGQMDTDGNLVTSSVADLGVITLAGNGGTGFVTTVVDFAAGGYEVAMNDLAGSGNPGF
ncbi:MAG: hypothetical protein RJA16_599, partial [Planctomycetota bacterium]